MVVEIKNLPIGVFDSGIGGLTVLKELCNYMPEEGFIYLGDTARVPYGTKNASTIIKYARFCSSFLFKHGLKMLVVACNTASSVAIDFLKVEFDIPVIGVIEPSAEFAVNYTKNGKIGVIGTPTTISSGAYQRIITSFDTRVEVIAIPTPLFVPLAEEGWVEGEVPRLVCQKYLTPFIKYGVDTLVLGCTHYPLLKKIISSTLDELSDKKIKVIDSAIAVAKKVKSEIEKRERIVINKNAQQTKFYATDSPENFALIGSRFFNKKINDVQLVDLC